MSYNHTGKNRMQRPLSVGDWIMVFLLLGIPVVGFILIIYWSFGENVNINKKNFSKATLLLIVLTFALIIFFAIFFGQTLSNLNITNPKLI